MKIDETLLEDRMNETLSNLKYYDMLGAKVVDEYSSELDVKVNEIQAYMKRCREFNADFDVPSLQRICMELSSVIYYTQDKLERLGLLEDLSNIAYKDKYGKKYLEKQADHDAGTKYSVEQLKNYAEQEALPEKLTNFIYAHAASIIKGKIESAYELLKASSKALSASIESMKMSGTGYRFNS